MVSAIDTLGCMSSSAFAWLLAVTVVACGDGFAEFRPAKGIRDLPSSKAAYRVQSVGADCERIGFVVRATSVEEIADVVADHGGTHYVVLTDQASTSTETDIVASRNFGVTHGHASSTDVKHHRFTAEAYRCGGS